MKIQQIVKFIKLAELNFTNRLSFSCPYIFLRVQTTPLQNPILLHINLDLLKRLEIDSRELQKNSFLSFLNGDLDFEGLLFTSSYYSGHQFGHYVPRLGDGRAIMLGEIKSNDGLYYELQLKGAGATPFSRMGDGKAVVRSSIREYLASAHLKALNIPTTEALAIVSGNDDVYREEIEKSAIVLRTSESFLRFGHFQYYAHTSQYEELETLLKFTIDNYFSEISDHPNRYILFFQTVVKKTAKLFAAWQAIGFCHGVLNTDNMSILGLTIDYGPFGFIDHFDLEHVCNHSDHEGRYSLGNQPPIGMWNLEQLGVALARFIDQEALARTLETYPKIFHFEYRKILQNKLGLNKNILTDDDLIKKMLTMLVATKIDYTHFFRELSHYQTTKKLSFDQSIELRSFLLDYEERLLLEETTSLERQENMLLTNPKFILRNYLAQMAIENYHNDPKILANLFEILTHPFDEWPEFEEWSKSTPSKYLNFSVSCSS